MFTGDPLHSRALAHSRAPLFTQPCPHCSHSRDPGEQWARLCVFTLQGCVQAARLCRGSPVMFARVLVSSSNESHVFGNCFTASSLVERPAVCIHRTWEYSDITVHDSLKGLSDIHVGIFCIFRTHAIWRLRSLAIINHRKYIEEYVSKNIYATQSDIQEIDIKPLHVESDIDKGTVLSQFSKVFGPC